MQKLLMILLLFCFTSVVSQNRVSGEECFKEIISGEHNIVFNNKCVSSMFDNFKLELANRGLLLKDNYFRVNYIIVEDETVSNGPQLAKNNKRSTIKGDVLILSDSLNTKDLKKELYCNLIKSMDIQVGFDNVYGTDNKLLFDEIVSTIVKKEFDGAL